MSRRRALLKSPADFTDEREKFTYFYKRVVPTLSKEQCHFCVVLAWEMNHLYDMKSPDGRPFFVHTCGIQVINQLEHLEIK